MIHIAAARVTRGALLQAMRARKVCAHARCLRSTRKHCSANAFAVSAAHLCNCCLLNVQPAYPTMKASWEVSDIVVKLVRQIHGVQPIMNQNCCCNSRVRLIGSLVPGASLYQTNEIGRSCALLLA